MRYTGELLGSLFGLPDVRRFAKRVKRLQDGLGYENDVRVGREVIRELCKQSADKEGIAAAGARVLGWHEHAIGKVDHKLRRYLRRLKHTDPFW